MKLGLIARQDNTGVGLQTWELFRHLDPYTTVALTMGDVEGHVHRREFPERYPGSVPATYSGTYGSGRIRPYCETLSELKKCDVVLTVETPYDHMMVEDLQSAGVKVVVVANREFLEWIVNEKLPRPDLFISPSSWCLDQWPENTVFLPHPVDRKRLPFRARRHAERFLHLAARAFRDRAGTEIVSFAAGMFKGDVTVRTQDPLIKKFRHVKYEVKDIDNYWDVYDGMDVLVAPRRYGGQSLPVNEALSLGMPVIALDREPERSMLPKESLIPATMIRMLKVSGGEVPLYNAKPALLAQRMREFQDNPRLVRSLSLDADERAQAISWSVLKPRWEEVLAGV